MIPPWRHWQRLRILPALVRAASPTGAKPTRVGSPVAGIFWVVQKRRPCRLQPPRRPRCCERTSPMRCERQLVGHCGRPPPGPLDPGQTPPSQCERRVEGARVPGRRAGETRFCLAAFLRSASQLVAPAENRWRRRAARGERASAGPVSTRGDWRSLGRGPGVRVDGTARATSQSAKPRSWRHPSPPPQPTQPVPAQTACSDGEVGRARCAWQARARQHGAFL